MKQRFSGEQLFRLALVLGVLAALIPLVLYAYLGMFSRYGSDDYCLSAFFHQDHLGRAMIERYNTSSSRYTNILFIGLVDKAFGWYNVVILPGLMIALLVSGLYLFLKEIGEMIGLRWSRWLFLLLSLLLSYFSIVQAPDLYETLYWRAGMTSHFAPVVFIPFFGAFLLRQIRNAKQRFPSILIQAACFVIPLLIGGLSEPPTALMITVLVLAIGAAWWWSDARHRRSVLMILAWALAGALIALIVMAVAPANSIRTTTAPPGLIELVKRIITYPVFFIVDTLRTLPLPTLVSVVLPLLLFYEQYVHSSEALSKEARKRLGILLILVLLLTHLFIAASFAPSAYGQSYPIARSRFIGRLLLTAAFMMEGALLGVLAAEVKVFQSTYLRGGAMVALILLALYPLRTAWRVSAEIPDYREYAVGWDERDAEIRRLRAEGVRDLTVRFLSAERTQDLGDRSEFRLNRCASILYDIDSIVVRPMKK
ncbi:MAG TPA: DUF6056 family protein [Anaerolineales bacterium]|nr:DUF6056 family protein [Anaerolineales bacterium]